MERTAGTHLGRVIDHIYTPQPFNATLKMLHVFYFEISLQAGLLTQSPFLWTMPISAEPDRSRSITHGARRSGCGPTRRRRVCFCIKFPPRLLHTCGSQTLM